MKLEEILRLEFLAKGGLPELTAPIYFFLGRNSGFEEHPRNHGFTIDLQDISSHLVSFIYGDSMLAYFSDYRVRSGVKYQNSLCAKLFTKEELAGLFSHCEYPQDGALHIKCQLWKSPSSSLVKQLPR